MTGKKRKGDNEVGEDNDGDESKFAYYQKCPTLGPKNG